MTPSPSKKHSWFGVFSWSNHKEMSIAEVKVEMDSAPDAPDHIHVCAESSDDRPKLDSLATIKPADLPSAVTELRPLSEDTVSQFPYSASIPQSKITKVDAPTVQPLPHSQPSPLPHHSPVPRTQEGASLPAVPNPSASVFALNFPMLAKPKLPSVAADIPSPRKPEPSIATSGMDVLIMV